MTVMMNTPLPMHVPASCAPIVPVEGLGEDEIMVDNFAGGGGASTGLKWTTGRDPDVALNHDAPACAMFRANHPATLVLNQSVTAMAPIDTVLLGSRHRAERLGRVWDGKPMRVGLAWFSPDCTDHSKAKGGAPIRNRASRDLAFVIHGWAQLPPEIRPRIIMMENVEEWLGWGPLRQRRWPLKPEDRAARKGLFADDSQGAGEEQALTDPPLGEPMFDAHGNPVLERDPTRAGETFRKWLRKLQRCGYTVEYRELRASVYGAPTIRKRLFLIARCDGGAIHWPAETHGANRSPVRTAAECIDFSIPCPSIFTRRKMPVDASCRRIARGIRRFVIDAAKRAAEGKGPGPYLVPVTHQGDDRVHSLHEPLRTITTAKRGEYALISPTIIRTDMQSAAGRNGIHSVETPINTVTTNGGFGLVAATLVPRYGEREGQAPRCQDITRPISTIVPTANGAQLVAAFLAQHNGGARNAAAPLSRPVDEPISAIVTRGTQQQLVAAFIKRDFGTSTGSDMRAPIGTLTTEGNGHATLVAAFLSKYYSSGADADAGDDAGGQSASLDAPLHTATAKARFGLVTVTIEGQSWVIVDIGMRMLTPRELFNCQGFNDNYVIDVELKGELLDADRRARMAEGKGKRRKRRDGGYWLTKEDQIRMCGNSVPPPMSMVLSAANLNIPPAMPFGTMREAA